MDFIATILPYIQIFLSVAIVTLVLLQQSEAGLGGAFGGGDSGATNRTRRGSEKLMFNLTIAAGILFVLSAFVSLVLF